jgi:hypothetical protein
MICISNYMPFQNSGIFNLFYAFYSDTCSEMNIESPFLDNRDKDFND